MGRPKALLPLGGQTCVARVAGLLRACGADPVVVVTGVHNAIIREALETDTSRPVVVFNPAHDTGQLSSLLAGLDVVEGLAASAVVVALVDHPAVRSQTVAALIDRWRLGRPPVVRPVYQGRHGHPVVFDRAVWPLLRAAPATEGARPVIRGLADQVVDVVVDDAGVTFDLDQPEDYAALIDAIDRGAMRL
jgi:molybdenum cofactor cytidylyltransferase